jgi:hypothetical protein
MLLFMLVLYVPFAPVASVLFVDLICCCMIHVPFHYQFSASGGALKKVVKL